MRYTADLEGIDFLDYVHSTVLGQTEDWTVKAPIKLG